MNILPFSKVFVKVPSIIFNFPFLKVKVPKISSTLVSELNENILPLSPLDNSENALAILVLPNPVGPIRHTGIWQTEHQNKLAIKCFKLSD